MRLCMVADGRSPHTRRWIEPLVRGGHEVHLLSYRAAPRVPDGLAGFVDLTALDDTPRRRFLVWARHVRRTVRWLRPDVLHAHQITAAGWLGAAAGYHPFVVSAWGSDVLVEESRGAFRRWLLRRVIARCDRLAVPSPLLWDEASRLGAPDGRLRLVPWGVDRSVFRPEPDDRADTRRALGVAPGAPLVLSPRAIAPLYRIRRIVDAVADLRGEISDVRLALVRFRPERAYLAQVEARIRARNLDTAVCWIPEVESDAEMARLYRAADAVVSVPASEGYGSSVREAAACGCPVVTADLPALRDAFVDGEEILAVANDDADALRHALGRLLRDPAVGRRLRAAALARASHPGESRGAPPADALYRELLGVG